MWEQLTAIDWPAMRHEEHRVALAAYERYLLLRPLALEMLRSYGPSDTDYLVPHLAPLWTSLRSRVRVRSLTKTEEAARPEFARSVSVTVLVPESEAIMEALALYFGEVLVRLHACHWELYQSRDEAYGMDHHQPVVMKSYWCMPRAVMRTLCLKAGAGASADDALLQMYEVWAKSLG